MPRTADPRNRDPVFRLGLGILQAPADGQAVAQRLPSADSVFQMPAGDVQRRFANAVGLLQPVNGVIRRRDLVQARVDGPVAGTEEWGWLDRSIALGRMQAGRVFLRLSSFQPGGSRICRTNLDGTATASGTAVARA